MDFLSNGLLSFCPHLLTYKTADHFEDGAVLNFGLHYDVALPNLVLLVSVAYVLDVEDDGSFLFVASPKMVKEEVSF